MDVAAQFDAILSAAGRLGIQIRREHMGGDGGGVCTIRGKPVLFVDEDADLGTRLERCVDGLSKVAGIAELYLPPEIRERLDVKMGELSPEGNKTAKKESDHGVDRGG